MELVADKSFLIDEIPIYLKIFELFKSYLIIISNKKEMGIGDVTLGTPSRIKGLKSTSSTFNLFGMHNDLVSPIIAKKSSFILNKPVLVLFFCTVEIEESSFIKPLITSVNASLNELCDKK